MKFALGGGTPLQDDNNRPLLCRMLTACPAKAGSNACRESKGFSFSASRFTAAQIS